MSRPSGSALARALFCVVAFVFAWLSLETAARAQGGSDTCAAPPQLFTTDTGSTGGMTNDTPTVDLPCNGIYTQVAGPDVFYEVDVGPGNNFQISVAPSGGYDTSIYLMSPACGIGNDCQPNWGADVGGAGVPETITFSGLPPGVYYLGIDSFYPSTDPLGRESGSYTVTVAGSLGSIPTNITVAPSPPSTVYGQPVTFTATVASSVGTPAGTVTFNVDATTQTVPVVGGQAVFTISTLAAGPHNVVATFNGSGPYQSSTAVTAYTVAQAATTTTLFSSSSPSMAGTPVVFTASVAATTSVPTTPTGSVAFTIDGMSPPTVVPLDPSGNAALTLSNLAAGSHTIVATYSGDSNFTASTSAPLTQVVSTNASTTTLVAAPEPSVYGQSVTFTATISAGAGGMPTGTVSFSLDGGPPVNVTLTSGQAAFTTSAMTPGAHSMTAAYGGDASHMPSSASTMHVVNVSGTDIALTFSPNPAVALQVVTLIATVTAAPPGAGTPTGVVQFRDGGNTFGSATLSNGVATLRWGFDAGTHSISALYVGDTNFQGSFTADQSLTVNKADSTTILSTSANPAPVGVPVTFTATVSANPPGNGTPTGTVTFLNGATTLGTGTIDANGHAVFSTSALAVGTYSITASYGGDNDRNTSTSAAVSQKITMDAATVALTSSANPAALGANVTFTATVSSPSDAGTPTGSITFADGTTMLGNVPLTGGVATFSTSSLAGGHHTITATYSGDAVYTGGAIGSLVETITAAPTTTALTAMPNPAMLGSAITLQATVTSTVSGTPTGSVAFVDGTSSLGTVPLSGNTASLMTSSLPVGMHSIHAAYSGDTNFASSVSPDVTEAVDGPADGGVPDGGSRDAEADGPTDAGVDSGTGGDAEAEGGGPEAGGSDSSVGPGDAGMDGSLMGDAPTFEGGVTPPDAGTATNEGGSCGCRVAGSDETGSSVLALSWLAAIAGAFAFRRSQRSDRTRGASR